MDVAALVLPAGGTLIPDTVGEGSMTSCSDDGESESTMDTAGQGDEAVETLDVAELSQEEPGKLAAVAAYLEPYGFLVEDSFSWPGAWREGTLPVARLRVKLHTEVQGHTVYLVECALTPLGGEEPALAWSTTQRLSQLRPHFHDKLKNALGAAVYKRHFQATPFAHRMGPPGTTSRLHAWFQSLAACMTAGLLRPSLVAEVLRSLEAPAEPRRSGSPPPASPCGAALGGAVAAGRAWRVAAPPKDEAEDLPDGI